MNEADATGIIGSRDPGIGDAGIPLPPEVGATLDRLILRARRIILLRGLLATAAVALAAVLVVMAVDAGFMIFNPVVRWALSAAALAVIVAAAVRWLVVPLGRPISRKAVARAVEVRHPEIEERLSTAVEMAGLPGDAGFGGSRELLAKVVASAAADAGTVDPEREFSSRSVKRFLWMAAVPAVVLAGALALWPRQSSILLMRAIAPFSEIGNAWSGRIREITGNVIVAKGEPVTLEVVIEDPNLARAELRSRITGASGETIERMEKAASPDALARRFVHHVPAVHESFEYRIRCGKALSAPFRVEARERPSAAAVEITLDHPDYTRLPDTVLPPEIRAIEALAGTRVTVRATPTRPVATAVLTVDGEPLVPAGEGADESDAGEAPAEDRGDPREWRFVLPAGLESTWRIDFEDAAGITGGDGDHPVSSTDDERPTITLVSPTERDLRLRPTERLPISYVATEDFGFAAAEMSVVPDPGQRQVIPMDPPTRSSSAAGDWEGGIVLDLDEVELGTASLVRVRLHLRDALPEELGGPQEAASEEIRIRIDQGAPTLMEQNLAAHQESVRQSIHEVLNELRDTKWRADDSRQRVAQRDDLQADDLERLQEVADGARKASDSIDALAREVARSPFARQAPSLAGLAEETTRPASERAAEIPLLDEKDERVAEAEAMQAEIAEAIAGLEQTLGDIERMRPELEQAARLDRLAQDQRALAREATRAAESPAAASAQAPAAPPSPEEMRDWQRRQEALANQIRQAAAEREALAARAAAMNARGEEARELASQAAALADQEALLEEMIARREESAPSGSTENAATGEGSSTESDDPLVQALLAEQSAIAEATSSMAKAAPSTPTMEAAAGGLEAAAREAGLAAESLASNQPAAAARSAGEAADRLAALEQSLPPTKAGSGAMPGEAGESPSAPGDEGAGSPTGDPEAGSSPADGELATAEAVQVAPAPGEEESTPDGSAGAPGESGDQGPEGSRSGDSVSGSEAPTTEAVAALARRQAAVAGLLDALADARLDEGLAEMQTGLAADAAALADAAEALEAAAGGLPMGSAFQQAVAEGTAQAGEASSQAGSAAEQLSTPSPATPAEALEQAIAAGTENPASPTAGATPESRRPAAGAAASQPGTASSFFAEALRADTPPSPARSAAGQARQALSEASQSFASAAESLQRQAAGMAAEAAGVSTAAGEASQAAEAAGQAARQAEDAASSPPGSSPPTDSGPPEGSMASAAGSAATAAEALAQAAQGAMQAAGTGGSSSPASPSGMPSLAGTPAGQQPGPPSGQPGRGQPGTPQGPPSGEGAEPGDAGPQPNAGYAEVPPALARLGVTAADWMRIKGTARSGVAGAATGTAPEEYRELVRSYFEELARQASEESP